MLTKVDLENLREYREGPGKVLSVYLDLDQSNAANLNRGFELALESKLRAIETRFEEEYEQREFTACANLVRAMVCKHRPGSRSLVLFAKANGSIWINKLDVPLATDARWAETAYIEPFVEALDEFEICAVVLADRSRARIFTVALGNIEERAELHAFSSARHIKTTGTDHLYSQSHFQRKADEHASSHLRRVAGVLETVERTHPFDRLILAGTTEAIAELFTILPKALRAKVISATAMSTDASEKLILERALELERDAERAYELRHVGALITAAAKDAKAVVGMTETLNALNDKRVRELVYSQGLAVRGGFCKTCGTAFPEEDAVCRLCNLPAAPVDDIVETALGLALSEGAEIEQIRGQAAQKLNGLGGIGAFLRF